MKKVLFVSGSVGLGHVVRDIEIAKELRKLHHDIEISWVSEAPASEILERAGEKLLPEATLLYSSNSELEQSTKQYEANLSQWAMNVRKGWSKNGEIYSKISHSYDFDLWVGDESYDIMIAMVNNPSLKTRPFVVIYDFLGLNASTWNPKDRIVAYMANRIWVRFLMNEPPLADKSIFIGEPEDVPDKSFGPLLPNRRRLSEKMINFVGYVVPEDIENYRDKTKARELLGYGAEPLIVCSIGGTAVGKNLLDLCILAYPIAKEKIADLKMVLVCGPCMSKDSIKAREGVKVVGYVPELYKHLGAADLGVVSGGGTITLELTALKRPFIYFPLEHHLEQEFDVSRRCQRHNAGVPMNFSKTTPNLLAERILENIGKETNYASIPINGAANSALLISQTLSEHSH